MASHEPAKGASIVAPALPSHVWTGWLEEFRQWVTPTTDACEESIYAAGLLALSCAIGRTCSIDYGASLYSNLYIAIVGPSSVARKSTMLNRARVVLERAFSQETLRWARSIGSAEGLLERFCREQETGEGKNRRLIFGPIPGQRVILDESELTGLFVKMSRPATANLPEILLDLYDGRDFKPPLRSRPMEVQQPFFSILSATTPAMLEKRTEEWHITSGLLPRFAFFLAIPRDPMCYPKRPSQDGLEHLAKGLQRLSLFAQELSLELSPDALRSWEPIYYAFEEEKRVAEMAGPEGQLLKRVDALAMKVALLYALMRGHQTAYQEDIHAGASVARYCADVINQLPFGRVETTRNARISEQILSSLDGEWTFPSTIHERKLSGRVSGDEFRRELDGLERTGLIESEEVMVNGRQFRWYRRVHR